MQKGVVCPKGFVVCFSLFSMRTERTAKPLFPVVMSCCGRYLSELLTLPLNTAKWELSMCFQAGLERE
jgi:hypothetical protein